MALQVWLACVGRVRLACPPARKHSSCAPASARQPRTGPDGRTGARAHAHAHTRARTRVAQGYRARGPEAAAAAADAALAVSPACPEAHNVRARMCSSSHEQALEHYR